MSYFVTVNTTSIYILIRILSHWFGSRVTVRSNLFNFWGQSTSLCHFSVRHCFLEFSILENMEYSLLNVGRGSIIKILPTMLSYDSFKPMKNCITRLEEYIYFIYFQDNSNPQVHLGLGSRQFKASQSLLSLMDNTTSESLPCSRVDSCLLMLNTNSLSPIPYFSSNSSHNALADEV